MHSIALIVSRTFKHNKQVKQIVLVKGDDVYS
jgi:hypothetical protein